MRKHLYAPTAHTLRSMMPQHTVAKPLETRAGAKTRRRWWPRWQEGRLLV